MPLLDGKKINTQLLQTYKKYIIDEDLHPKLSVILVGDDPSAKSYISAKENACKKIGIDSDLVLASSDISESKLLKIIKELNEDPSVTGILIQLPLPKTLNDKRILLSVDPRKDVDGFHPLNIGFLNMGYPFIKPCTPLGIILLLKSYRIPLAGKKIAVLGRSNLVGKPLSTLLTQEDATVTLCHTKTENLKEVTLNSDIVISAIGKPCFIDASYIKKGTVFVDVGCSRVEDILHPKGYYFTGDGDFSSLEKVCSYITPVPGGVGPMTVAMLMYNTIRLAKHQKNGKWPW